MLAELGWRSLSAWGQLMGCSAVCCSRSSWHFPQRAGLQRVSSPAGCRAPRQAAVPGGCPRGSGSSLFLFEHGAGTDGLPLLSCANLQARRLHSCLGNHWGVTVQALKWAIQYLVIRFANPRPKISLISINSNLFALSGTNLKICFKSWLGTWYSVFCIKVQGKQWA